VAGISDTGKTSFAEKSTIEFIDSNTNRNIFLIFLRIYVLFIFNKLRINQIGK
jgi:hypothetical protein